MCLWVSLSGLVPRCLVHSFAFFFFFLSCLFRCFTLLCFLELLIFPLPLVIVVFDRPYVS